MNWLVMPNCSTKSASVTQIVRMMAFGLKAKSLAARSKRWQTFR
eukprot:CAMPEP_0180548004 /NCGR_PEP_ID=MMETSP1036_2-20121128/71388_1 /TAXON_ID=632150 /ORGANISM="Azadinium spinosum, Strain 3D9" /LENGTH=43 /DNA_ID= /DNA_START= /DNA_END= /DNA_ORIENTATION=